MLRSFFTNVPTIWNISQWRMATLQVKSAVTAITKQHAILKIHKTTRIGTLLSAKPTSKCGPNGQYDMQPSLLVAHLHSGVSTCSVNRMPLSPGYLEKYALSLVHVSDKVCNMEWWSNWSLFYVNQSTFHKNMY